MASRMVFFDEDEGKVNCHSCSWEGESDYLYNHYKDNHSNELLQSENNQLIWNFDKESSKKIFLACISDTMFWIHMNAIEDKVHVAVQYVECGEFTYNIRVRSSSDKLIVGNLDVHPIFPKLGNIEEIFKQDHFSIKQNTLEAMNADNMDPSFEITLFEGLEIDNGIGYACRVYKENDDIKYQCFNNPKTECISFNKDDYKCLQCLSDEVHISKLTMCDADHSICPDCKKGVSCCPVESCQAAYSSAYRNPAVEHAIKLFNLKGLRIPNININDVLN